MALLVGDGLQAPPKGRASCILAEREEQLEAASNNLRRESPRRGGLSWRAAERTSGLLCGSPQWDETLDAGDDDRCAFLMGDVVNAPLARRYHHEPPNAF